MNADVGMALLFRQVMDTIDRNGWAVIVAPDSDGLIHGYTVGLTFHRVPELHVQGVRPEKTHETLNSLAERHIKGDPFTAGQLTQAAGRHVKLEAMPDLGPLNMVRALFGDNDPVPPTALNVSFSIPPEVYQ